MEDRELTAFSLLCYIILFMDDQTHILFGAQDNAPTNRAIQPGHNPKIFSWFINIISLTWQMIVNIG